MKEQAEDEIIGTLNLRTPMAKFSIKYLDSADPGYDGTNIHNNYNGWIQSLDKSIQVQLSNF